MQQNLKNKIPIDQYENILIKGNWRKITLQNILDISDEFNGLPCEIRFFEKNNLYKNDNCNIFGQNIGKWSLDKNNLKTILHHNSSGEEINKNEEIIFFSNKYLIVLDGYNIVFFKNQ